MKTNKKNNIEIKKFDFLENNNKIQLLKLIIIIIIISKMKLKIIIKL